MKVLVTGCDGFIGYHLCSRLLQDGHSIVGIDSQNDYYDVHIKESRRLLLKKFDKFTGFTGDISDKNDIDMLNKLDFDSVVNLAGQAGVRYSIENPAAYFSSNLIGFFNILELCRNKHIKHLLYASSSSVYGSCENTPFSESEHLDQFESFYAVTKYTNELMARQYTKHYGLKTTGLRFFTVYGEMGRPDMMYYKMAESARLGRKIQVFGNGELYRDFTYISDIIDGIMAILEQSNTEDKTSEVYNIGGTVKTKLSDFIQIFENVYGVTLQKEYLPEQRGDVRCTHADTSKMKEHFNWEPKVSITEGLNNFIKWYKEFHGIE